MEARIKLEKKTSAINASSSSPHFARFSDGGETCTLFTHKNTQIRFSGRTRKKINRKKRYRIKRKKKEITKEGQEEKKKMRNDELKKG